MSKESKETNDFIGQKIKDHDALARALEKCRSLGWHVLSPVQKIDKLAPGHVVQLIRIDIDPNDERQCYRDKRWSQNERALTKLGLMDIWRAAVGRFQVSERTDSGSDSHLCTYQAGGQVKEPGGGWVTDMSTRTEDYRDGSEQVSGWSPKQTAEARRRIVERTESFAKNRVIRNIMGVKSKYTVEELEKPFVVVRTVYELNPDNPMDALMLAADGLGSTAALFQSPAFAGFLNTIATKHMDMLADGMHSRRPAGEIGDGGGPPDPPEPAKAAKPEEPAKKAAEPPADKVDEDPGEPPRDPLEESVLDFRASPIENQIEMIEALVKEKQWDGKLTKPVEQFTEDERAQFYTFLLRKPKPGEESALPFGD